MDTRPRILRRRRRLRLHSIPDIDVEAHGTLYTLRRLHHALAIADGEKRNHPPSLRHVIERSIWDQVRLMRLRLKRKMAELSPELAKRVQNVVSGPDSARESTDSVREPRGPDASHVAPVIGYDWRSEGRYDTTPAEFVTRGG